MVLAIYNKNANETEGVVDAIPRKVWVVRFCKAQKRDVCTCGTPEAYIYVGCLIFELSNLAHIAI